MDHPVNIADTTKSNHKSVPYYREFTVHQVNQSCLRALSFCILGRSTAFLAIEIQFPSEGGGVEDLDPAEFAPNVLGFIVGNTMRPRHFCMRDLLIFGFDRLT